MTSSVRRHCRKNPSALFFVVAAAVPPFLVATIDVASARMANAGVENARTVGVAPDFSPSPPVSVGRRGGLSLGLGRFSLGLGGCEKIRRLFDVVGDAFVAGAPPERRFLRDGGNTENTEGGNDSGDDSGVGDGDSNGRDTDGDESKGNGDEESGGVPSDESIPNLLDHYDTTKSNRDELINTTELLAMVLTYAPTSSPVRSPSLSPVSDDDKYDKFDDDDPRTPTSYPPEADFFEFVAFVCWYAFLIMCCLVPTACAYRRRRRNERALSDQIRLAQLRVAAGLDGERGGGADGEDEWDQIRRWFGAGMAGGVDRPRDVMLDIFGGSDRVRLAVERESRRRGESGRRLVEAIKETTMDISEYNLVSKEGSDQAKKELVVRSAVSGDGRHTNGSDDSEFGASTTSVESDSGPSSSPSTVAAVASGNCNDPVATGGENPDEVAAEDPIISSAVPVAPAPQAAPTAADSENAHLPMMTADDHPLGPARNDRADDTAAASSSLYDAGAYDFDDDENEYDALIIPAFAEADPPKPNAGPREVGATCAICLVPYAPGDSATWASNPLCVHAFHRDCITEWLLKKDEPLCPCCRREFVPRSMLRSVSSLDLAPGSGLGFSLGLGLGSAPRAPPPPPPPPE